MNNQWQSYPFISTQLNSVNQCIQEKLKCSNQELQDALVTMATNGGKYLRPAILLTIGQVCGAKDDNDQLIKLAASIEILHMATLVHDDIVDDSPKRRGAVSIQSRFGKDIAVYAGDLLFTAFFDLLLEAIHGSKYLEVNAHAMRKILDGELGQMNQRFNTKQSLDDYLDDVNGKTAALFQLAAQEGAHFAGGDEDAVQHAAEFGQKLGIAFQMLDDILDYTGDDQLNKPVMEDLSTGVYSLPLLMALQADSPQSTTLESILAKGNQLDENDMNQIRQLVIESGAVEQSRELAGKFTQEALESLSALPDNKYNRFLTKMTKKLLKRTI
ncbi:MAG: polyprenyl synthetase family protein [Limosilactobacillus sp.]|uniref:polyprenyl synthetase family protein n=1 Tax=Limosilactobacillus sp. TaxID=2773925 RepID=UPI0027008AD0|nr:polyprenyl synthetase family protein [Limosilactobacillus sp.]